MIKILKNYQYANISSTDLCKFPFFKIVSNKDYHDIENDLISFSYLIKFSIYSKKIDTPY